MVVTGPWSDYAARLLWSGEIDGLDLNYAKGFKDTNLAFIEPWPIRRLSILARTVRDLAPVSNLAPTLVELSVDCGSAATLDLGRLVELRSLAAPWNAVAGSISHAAGLGDLYLGAYSCPDLEPLRWNVALQRLRMKDRPRLESLDGVGRFGGLRHLGVYGAPLNSAEGLAEVPGLRELHLESCRIGALGPIAGLAELRMLNIGDCGGVASVAPLRGLSNLSVLWAYESTRIMDGDLSPIAALPALTELRMQNRRSYRPSVSAIQAKIADRGERENG